MLPSIPLQASAGILHSDWLILVFLLAFPLSAYNIIDFLLDWKHSDTLNVIISTLAFIFSIIAAVTAQQQDFIAVTSTGAQVILTYQGEYWWLYILWPLALVNIGLLITTSAITLGTVYKKRKQEFIP